MEEHDGEEVGKRGVYTNEQRSLYVFEECRAMSS